MIKVDAGKRLVFGWAMVCTKAGEPYYDTDNQHFPEEVALDAWSEFMKVDQRTHKAMHNGEEVGKVLFAFPMTTDVAASMGFTDLPQTGIIAGVYVEDDDTLAKFKSGEYKSFSIGGQAVFEDEES